MKTIKNSTLKQQMNAKGISGDISKTEISYIKLIDGFKPLFISEVLDVRSIIEEQNEEELAKLLYSINRKNVQDKVKSITKYFDKKYGSDNSIEKYEPKRHIYNSSVEEFYEAFEFDSRLKNLLFPYILSVEEMLKKTVIQVMNDEKKSFDYLMKIEAYENANSMGPMLKIVNPIVRGNKNSVFPPIKHQVSRQLIPPYWLSIQALSFTEVVILLEKMNKDLSSQITQKLAQKVFPKYEDYIQFNTNGHTRNEADKEATIKRVRGIIFDFLYKIAALRNWVAHDMPLYLFKIKDANMAVNTNIVEFDMSNQDIEKFKANIIDTQHLWGRDSFNTRSGNVKPSIMYMIYILNKFSNNRLKSDIHKFFYHNHNKYLNRASISQLDCVSVKSIHDKINYSSVKSYVDTLNEDRVRQLTKIDELLLSLDDLVKSIEEGTAYSRKLRSLKRELSSMKNSNIIEVTKNENNFKHMQKYSFFTQITYDFINNL